LLTETTSFEIEIAEIEAMPSKAKQSKVEAECPETKAGIIDES
jgi:hypothetical protein